MKKCPNCDMTVDAYSECPICGGDLMNTPQSEVEIEKYRLNKWFFMYLIKRHKLSLMCTIVVLFRIFLSITTCGYWQGLSVLLIVIMWIEALYKNFVYKMLNNIYSDTYLETTNKITLYACGIFAIVLAFF